MYLKRPSQLWPLWASQKISSIAVALVLDWPPSKLTITLHIAATSLFVKVMIYEILLHLPAKQSIGMNTGVKFGLDPKVLNGKRNPSLLKETHL